MLLLTVISTCTLIATSCIIRVWTTTIYHLCFIISCCKVCAMQPWESADNSTVSISVFDAASSVCRRKPADTCQCRQRVKWECRHQWRAAADAAEWSIFLFTATTLGLARSLAATSSRVHCCSVVQLMSRTLGLHSSIQLLQPVSFVQLIVSNQSVRVTRICLWRHTESVVACNTVSMSVQSICTPKKKCTN